jgi:anthranilate synthase component 1
VKLTERMVIERYSHVMHIVSNVEGTLKPGLTSIDVLRAAFPAGHGERRAEGARDADHRRARAVEARRLRGRRRLRELPGRHGHGDRDRTAVVKDGMLYAQAGAGIVHDSVPESEWTETENKARAVLRAAEMVQQGLDAEA